MAETPAGADHIDVVIAEDSRIQAKILKKHLENAGYNVRVGPDGAAALTLIQQQPPTIIISDIEMPEMNGYELCRAVKSDPELRRIPLILLSTLSAPEDIILGLQAGADNYVTKPYDATYLLSRIQSLLHTPLGDDTAEGPALEVTLAGKRHAVRSGRQQVLNLLISTFENAVEKNSELIRVNQQLTVARDQMALQNQQLSQLNEQLESANTRMSRALEAAAKVQHALLPSATPSAQGVNLSWRYMPCDELAGDFLNLFPLDDTHLALFVVDVSGHGVASSLLAVTIGRVLTPHVSASSLLIRQTDPDQPPTITHPNEVIAELNKRFPMEEQGGLYFTIAYGVLDLQSHVFRFASGGHTPLVLLSANGDVSRIDADGMAIGWMDDIEFEEVPIQLSPGDRLFLYSDGVPEAMDPDLNEYTDQRMLDHIVETHKNSLDESVGGLLESVQQWCNPSGPKDDVSILAFEIRKETT